MNLWLNQVKGMLILLRSCTTWTWKVEKNLEKIGEKLNGNSIKMLLAVLNKPYKWDPTKEHISPHKPSKPDKQDMLGTVY